MQQPKDERYTYTDYLTWEGDERYELIDGVPYMMAPAPSSTHQGISANLMIEIGTYLRGKRCKVFAAPFDVRLNADTRDDTVVQPDISVICDPSKIDERGCKGAPDMVIEIVSPSSVKHDQFVKQEKYRQAGVREYWIVYPEYQSVQVYILKDGAYVSGVYEDKAHVPVKVLEGCVIDLGAVFPQAEDAADREGT